MFWLIGHTYWYLYMYIYTYIYIRMCLWFITQMRISICVCIYMYSICDILCSAKVTMITAPQWLLIWYCVITVSVAWIWLHWEGLYSIRDITKALDLLTMRQRQIFFCRHSVRAYTSLVFFDSRSSRIHAYNNGHFANDRPTVIEFYKIPNGHVLIR